MELFQISGLVGGVNIGGVEVGEVLLDGDTFKERLEERVGSLYEGGAGVDDGLVARDIDVAVEAV